MVSLGQVIALIKAMGGSGGGSSLPAVTSADNGKGLSVQGTPVAGAVIVPEQTAAYDDYSESWLLTNCNTELFTEDATVLLTIDDHSEVCTVFAEDGHITATFSDGSGGIGYNNGDMYAWATDGPDTLSVSCTLASYTYGWAVDPYMGYDVVVRMDKDRAANDLTDDDLHLLRGSFQDCVAKIDAALPIRACVYSHRTGANNFASVENYTVSVNGHHDYGDDVALYVTGGGGEYDSITNIYLTESGLSLTRPA